MTRREAWLEYAKKEHVPMHDDVSEGGQSKNYWQQAFYAGWDAGEEGTDGASIRDVLGEDDDATR